ncbi:MAG: guanylate kinase [Christensenellaceae bacterium]|nr:guanylate kinase [Christensenellaceae bacterium]
MDNDKKGLLFVISGPSGVGKGTICKKLLERRKELKLSVSVTTRAPRPGEIEGVNYFFRSEEQFQDMIERDEFLEYMCVFGKNHYGTPKAYVAEQRAQGNDVILEIDVNGALNVKKRCPDAVMIFIAPPSMETLKKRLVGRGTETEEAVERRFAEAVKELAAAGEYDYIVVNDSLDKAVKDTESILVYERLHVSNNPKLINILKGE